jgi:hypothetical protein
MTPAASKLYVPVYHHLGSEQLYGLYIQRETPIFRTDFIHRVRTVFPPIKAEMLLDK